MRRTTASQTMCLSLPQMIVQATSARTAGENIKDEMRDGRPSWELSMKKMRARATLPEKAVQRNGRTVLREVTRGLLEERGVFLRQTVIVQDPIPSARVLCVHE